MRKQSAPNDVMALTAVTSGVLAYAAVDGALRWKLDGTMALVNLLGCAALGVAAVGAYVLPSSTSEVSEDSHEGPSRRTECLGSG